MSFKQVWHWVSVGRWRRWCIPGAILGAATPFVLSVLSVMFRDNQKVSDVLIAVRDWLTAPLRIVLYRTFLREYDFLFKYYPILVIIWFVLLGVMGGLLIGLVCKFWVSFNDSENINDVDDDGGFVSDLE